MRGHSEFVHNSLESPRQYFGYRDIFLRLNAAASGALGNAAQTCPALRDLSHILETFLERPSIFYRANWCVARANDLPSWPAKIETAIDVGATKLLEQLCFVSFRLLSSQVSWVSRVPQSIPVADSAFRDSIYCRRSRVATDDECGRSDQRVARALSRGGLSCAQIPRDTSELHRHPVRLRG